MTTIKKFFLVICVLFIIKSEAQQLSEGQNQFALALFSTVAPMESGNFVFPPYSIFSNLALLYFGAENHTAQEIEETLHLPTTGEQFLETFNKQLQMYSGSKDQKGYQFSSANGIFLDKGMQILKPFQTIAKKFFEANVQTVDYADSEATIQTINHWIRERTEGKISSFLHKDDIDRSTKLILANAVYFQAEWATPFDPKETARAPFYFDDANQEEVNMMHRLGQFSYIEDEQIQGVVLPFYRLGVHHPRIDCLLVLPKENFSLTEFEEKLTTEQFSQWLTDGKKSMVEINVPKFCFNFRVLLNDPLETLGMQEAFTHEANLSKINGMRNLSIQRVIHSTYFSFQENGVTAAASTSINIGITSIGPDTLPPIPFVANRPFFFVVFDHHSKTILFLGHVKHPSLGKCNEK